MPDASPSNPDMVSVRGAGGKEIQLELLHSRENNLSRIRVYTTPNYMRVFLQYEFLNHSHRATATELREVLDAARVVQGVEPAALEIFRDLVNAKADVPSLFQVARGTLPVPGKDAYVEFFVQPTSRQARYDTDEQGNVNYRNLHLIENATEGQHIAELRPPTKGLPGRNVMGRIIPAADGGPLSVRVGQGIRCEESSGDFYAEADGRILYDRNEISLSTQYEVRGDVDYSVGTIDFVGEVIIRGSVLDDFHVTGRKGVRIGGTVGNSRIVSDGDVQVAGGMMGKGHGAIQAGGTVHARYLNDVTVEARGDVVVSNEIVNSRIRTTGKVDVVKGTLLGGEVLAFRGVECQTAGSEIGVATEISAGLDWTTEREVYDLELFERRSEKRVREVESLVAPLFRERERLLQTTAEQREMLAEVLARLRVLRTALQQTQARQQELAEQRQAGRVAQLNVREMLYQGVRLRFPNLQYVAKDNHRGPLTVMEDARRETVRLVPLFPLGATPEGGEGGKGRRGRDSG